LFVFWNLDFGAPEFESKDLMDEGVDHTTTDNYLIRHIDHFADQFQFIDNFCTSQNGQYWFFGFFNKTAKVLNLFFHQQTCSSDFVSDSRNTAVISMSCTKGVVNVNVSEL
jgi:hypothetical protein